MNHILNWHLGQDLKLIISADIATLATITCCDALDMKLVVKDQTTMTVLSGFTGCRLQKIKDQFALLVTGRQPVVKVSDELFFGKDLCGNVLVEIRQGSQPYCYALIDHETLQAWISQLELLQVVMEENENEQKSRGTGCCG